MRLPYVVLGDPTSSGGTVITGSPSVRINGVPVVRVGDQATCPVDGHHQIVVVIEGDDFHLDQGRPVAYHGCSLSCGCKVMATQGLTMKTDG